VFQRGYCVVELDNLFLVAQMHRFQAPQAVPLDMRALPVDQLDHPLYLLALDVPNHADEVGAWL
jgi:hypothetical protein